MNRSRSDFDSAPYVLVALAALFVIVVCVAMLCDNRPGGPGPSRSETAVRERTNGATER